MKEYIKKKIIGGAVFALGFFGTTVFAVAISGTIKTWTSGEVLKSADLNTTIASLKTAIEGITSSQWTTSGSNISYTSGNVGIGTTSPEGPLTFAGATGQKIELYSNATNGNEFGMGVESAELRISTGIGSFMSFYTGGYSVGSEKMRITSGGLVGVGRTPTTHPLEVQGTAGLTTGTAWTNISDERLKEIDGKVSSALESLLKLDPIKYKYNETSGKLFKNADGKSKYGFTAQNVKSVFPEMVITDDKGYLWYNPSGFEAILTSAIKELTHKLRSLENTADSSVAITQKINSLEKEKSANEKKVSALEAEVQRLKAENRRLLSLEDRIKAIETMQIATAAQAARK
ncbi:MAG TPA: tail fiber domain-containing protein [Leptospiraceae bacterium]|nr:tail fiber domain-containing protein [Leptospiraceae bacterium]HNH07064.1 tail fiber domain-containing protein [Leptospiraceae bacterium]HNN06802.1 tail fiber domain-containing protein [Leptospiraceae bacterium]